jgi:tetratricopeptide (TPR) repeat protein
LHGNLKGRRLKRIVTSIICISFFFSLNGFGQEGIDFDVKKPDKYENRTLGYEKTTTTKWTVPRAFLQNTITQYNFYFNANIKLNEVLARAKAQFREDYTQLLPFYNYTLEITSKDKRNLDSVLDRVNSAILLRDLRNSWADNLWMLMGRAYFYKNNLDSAHILFQFVNYAFAPRDPDGYPLPIGSNQEEGGNAFTISTNEKRNIAKRAFSQPPSRNESFIWQIRTYLQQEQLSRGAVLIEVLRQDPNFPARLQPSLHEMQALWNYKIKQWDSAAFHLSLALDNTTDQGEKARWEFLIAQLYERTGNPAESKNWYEKSASNTLDPALEVYARLNAIRQNKGTGSKGDYIQKNLDALRRMARKEIYEPYLDVIYYVAAEMELERNNKAAARILYKKCIQHANGLGYNRDRAFMKLGWIFMEDKMYPEAKYAYDSVNVSDPNIADSLKILLDRKQALSRIVPQILIIQRQDSLQRIAAMTPEEREAYIKKILRAYRKQQGLKEEDFNGGSGGYGFNTNNTNTDMFNTSGTGDWYFYNQAVKAKGYNDFKSKWGNRPNVDNWEVQSLVNRQITGLTPASNLRLNGSESGPATAPAAAQLTAQSLLEAIPLTPEKMKRSRDSVENALFTLGRSLQDYIPDYHTAIKTYDTLESQFPDSRFYQEALFNQYYCFMHLDDSVNAARILALMKQKFPTGRYIALIENPPKGPEDLPVRTLATKAYEQVYENLIEGHFDEAAAEKLKLDSTYGDKYWTPQLLYIEALYYIHYRYDSIGKSTLNSIITKYQGTVIAAKAKNVLRVLNERERIENYLRTLHVTRMPEDSIARAANGNAQPPTTKPAAKPPVANTFMKDSNQVELKKPDSLQLKKQSQFSSPFAWTPDNPQSVVLVMTKVDPVYVTESKNAFDRYNRENFYGKNYETSQLALSDSTKMMIIHGFDNAALALAYLDKAGNAAPREIIPWLPQTKFFFVIIDDQNLEILKANKDMQLYKKFLSVYAPDKFPPGK